MIFFLDHLPCVNARICSVKNAQPAAHDARTPAINGILKGSVLFSFDSLILIGIWIYHALLSPRQTPGENAFDALTWLVLSQRTYPEKSMACFLLGKDQRSTPDVES